MTVVEAGRSFTVRALGARGRTGLPGALPAAVVRAALSAAVIALLVSGCAASVGPSSGASSSPDAASGTLADLDGKTFRSTRLTGHELVPNTVVQLSFLDGRLSASAGCNSSSGAVDVAGGRLVVGALATTMIGCPPELQAQDEWLAGVLSGSPAWSLREGVLTIDGGGSVLVMEERQDQALVGVTWRLDTLISGEAASSVPEGVTASLLVEGDRASVNLGCNRGMGQALVDGDALTIRQLATTKMACPEPAAGVEAAFSTLLAGPVTWVIDGERLTLTSADGASGLGFQVEPAGPGDEPNPSTTGS